MFDHLEDITVNTLNFRPITDQAGTFTYSFNKVIAKYLKPQGKI